MDGFNPRAHGRRDSVNSLLLCKVLTFQSTRPREARLRAVIAINEKGGFQSTRPREARPDGCKRPWKDRSFNPRAHGRRDYNPGVDVRLSIVSIHAPTGGATGKGRRRNCLPMFQSTRPREARLVGGVLATQGAVFQSTRPREARPPIGYADPDPDGFNPRAHGRRDPGKWGIPRAFRVSIHAPTGGATFLWKKF